MSHPSFACKPVTPAAYDALCHKVIRASAVRHGWEAVHDETPLHEVLGIEATTPAGEEEREARQARQEHFRAFLQWLFGSGPHPLQVLRRGYLLAYALDRELIAQMTLADIGLLLGDKKQHQSHRLRLLFRGIFQARTQKRAGAREAYANAQRGNNSRRKGEWRKRREAARKLK